MNKLIHVALALYDKTGDYAKNLGVVMQSLFNNTSEKILVHVLHDRTLTPENKSKLEQIAVNFNQGLEFIDVSGQIKTLGQEALKLSRYFSLGAFFRLMLPDVLSTSKIIYLDCDVLVNLDIKSLWEIDIGESLIAGVLDPSEPHESWHNDWQDKLRLKFMGCDYKTCINSGVLVMNLQAISDEFKLIDEAGRWFARYGHQAILVDQDFINSFFKGRIKFLPERFNFHAGHRDLSNAIIHLIHSDNSKPWRKFKGLPAEKLYWQNFIKTPFYDGDAGNLINTLGDLAYKSSKTLRDRLCDRGSSLADFHLRIRPFRLIGILVREGWRRLTRRGERDA